MVKKRGTLAPLFGGSSLNAANNKQIFVENKYSEHKAKNVARKCEAGFRNSNRPTQEMMQYIPAAFVFCLALYCCNENAALAMSVNNNKVITTSYYYYNYSSLASAAAFKANNGVSSINSNGGDISDNKGGNNNDDVFISLIKDDKSTSFDDGKTDEDVHEPSSVFGDKEDKDKNYGMEEDDDDVEGETDKGKTYDNIEPNKDGTKKDTSGVFSNKDKNQQQSKNSEDSPPSPPNMHNHWSTHNGYEDDYELLMKKMKANRNIDYTKDKEYIANSNYINIDGHIKNKNYIENTSPRPPVTSRGASSPAGGLGDANSSTSGGYRSRFTIEELLGQRFENRISNDIYMDPCKAGGFLYDIAIPNTEYEKELQLQNVKDALYYLNHPEEAAAAAAAALAEDREKARMLTKFGNYRYIDEISNGDKNGQDSVTDDPAMIMELDDEIPTSTAGSTNVDYVDGHFDEVEETHLHPRLSAVIFSPSLVDQRPTTEANMSSPSDNFFAVINNGSRPSFRNLSVEMDYLVASGNHSRISHIRNRNRTHRNHHRNHHKHHNPYMHFSGLHHERNLRLEQEMIERFEKLSNTPIEPLNITSNDSIMSENIADVNASRYHELGQTQVDPKIYEQKEKLSEQIHRFNNYKDEDYNIEILHNRSTLYVANETVQTDALTLPNKPQEHGHAQQEQPSELDFYQDDPTIPSSYDISKPNVKQEYRLPPPYDKTYSSMRSNERRGDTHLYSSSSVTYDEFKSQIGLSHDNLESASDGTLHTSTEVPSRNEKKEDDVSEKSSVSHHMEDNPLALNSESEMMIIRKNNLKKARIDRRKHRKIHRESAKKFKRAKMLNKGPRKSGYYSSPYYDERGRDGHHFYDDYNRANSDRYGDVYDKYLSGNRPYGGYNYRRPDYDPELFGEYDNETNSYLPRQTGLGNGLLPFYSNQKIRGKLPDSFYEKEHYENHLQRGYFTPLENTGPYSDKTVLVHKELSPSIVMKRRLARWNYRNRYDPSRRRDYPWQDYYRKGRNSRRKNRGRSRKKQRKNSYGSQNRNKGDSLRRVDSSRDRNYNRKDSRKKHNKPAQNSRHLDFGRPGHRHDYGRLGVPWERKENDRINYRGSDSYNRGYDRHDEYRDSDRRGDVHDSRRLGDNRDGDWSLRRHDDRRTDDDHRTRRLGNRRDYARSEAPNSFGRAGYRDPFRTDNPLDFERTGHRNYDRSDDALGFGRKDNRDSRRFDEHAQYGRADYRDPLRPNNHLRGYRRLDHWDLHHRPRGPESKKIRPHDPMGKPFQQIHREHQKIKRPGELVTFETGTKWKENRPIDARDFGGRPLHPEMVHEKDNLRYGSRTDYRDSSYSDDPKRYRPLKNSDFSTAESRSNRPVGELRSSDTRNDQMEGSYSSDPGRYNSDDNPGSRLDNARQISSVVNQGNNRNDHQDPIPYSDDPNAIMNTEDKLEDSSSPEEEDDLRSKVKIVGQRMAAQRRRSIRSRDKRCPNQRRCIQKNRRSRRAATARKERVWDYGVIPYIIDANFTGTHKGLFKKAMRHWENYTCVKFVEKTDDHPNYIIFTVRECGCCSFVGKRGNGPQAISIGKNCDKFGIVVHELGHVVGFWHEHTRPDRENHVEIIRENIQAGQDYNFNKLTGEEVNSLGQRYDFGSIMHYARATFAKATYLDTIRPRPEPGMESLPEIGQRVKLSEGDIAQTNLLYKCPKCGRTFQDNSGVLRSPNFPSSMPPPEGERCEWRITATHGEKIVLNITALDIYKTEGCKTDYLEIRDGVWYKDPLLGRLCGNLRMARSLVSHGSRLLVTYVTSHQQTGHRGFDAHYEAVCGGSLEQEGGHLESPNYPDDYRPDKECVWLITVPDGFQVALRFHSFEIENHDECVYDYLDIRDGHAWNDTLIGVFCGYKTPEDVKSKGNRMRIKFVTDGSVQKAGFSATFMKEYDECQSMDHGCEHNCINQLGGYECQCNIGFELHSDGHRCEDACGGQIESSNGTITSPSFPDLYPINKNCIWELMAPPQYRITLNFTHFDLEGNNQDCEYDSVEIRSRLGDSELRKHGIYCGQQLPPVVTSDGNSLRIEFTSDNSVQKSGFAAVFFTDKDECASDNGGCQHICKNSIGSYQCSCHNGFTLHENRHDCKEGGCKHELTASVGEVFSPNYPDYYPSRKNCVWHFSTTPGHRIKLVFDEFEMEPHQECTYDYIILYDGNSSKAAKLGRYCGAKVPHPIVASTNQMFMIFKSDSSVQRKGFRARHTTVCGGHLQAGIGAVRHMYSHAKYGDQNYDNKEDCDWIIEAPDGKNVHLTFLMFEVEDEHDCGYDYVEVFSGYDDSGPSYGKFCGNSIPQEIVSINEALLVRFRSDDTINTKGFSAAYVAINEDDSSENSTGDHNTFTYSFSRGY